MKGLVAGDLAIGVEAAAVGVAYGLLTLVIATTLHGRDKEAENKQVALEDFIRKTVQEELIKADERRVKRFEEAREAVKRY